MSQPQSNSDIEKLDFCQSRQQSEIHPTLQANFDPEMKICSHPQTQPYINTGINYAKLKVNRPQSYYLLSAYFIFISGGMSWSWSIGFHTNHAMVSWFIGVLIGALVSACLANYIRKRVFNIASSVLVIVNGILYINENNLSFYILARYCDGIAFGMTLVTAIQAGSEHSVKRFRGQFLGVEQLGFSVGGFCGGIIVLFSLMYEYSNKNKFYGAVSIVLGVLGLVFAIFVSIESPVFLLRKYNEHAAVYALRKLQVPKKITNETYILLNENKALVEEDRNRGFENNISLSAIAVLKMIIFRCFIRMSTLLPMITFLTVSIDNTTIYWYFLMSFFGNIVSSYCLDTIGRKTTSGIALIAGGAVLLTVGTLGLLNNDSSSRIVFLSVVLVYQFISGFVAPASTCYLGEAFSITVKPYCIFIVVFAENILQIVVLLCLSDISLQTFSFTLGVMQILYGIVFSFIMPETKQTTLRDALKMFEPLITFKRNK